MERRSAVRIPSLSMGGTICKQSSSFSRCKSVFVLISCCSEESDDKLSKSKNDSAGKRVYFLTVREREEQRVTSLNSLCLAAADDFGSDENDFGEEEDEDGGSDYEEKRGKKTKKTKLEKPSKKGPKRKRVAGNSPG